MLSKRIYINTIFITMYTLRVTHKPYCVFEIYHVKYTNLVQSYTWPHFSVHCVVKSHVYHDKYTDFI